MSNDQRLKKLPKSEEDKQVIKYHLDHIDSHMAEIRRVLKGDDK